MEISNTRTATLAITPGVAAPEWVGLSPKILTSHEKCLRNEPDPTSKKIIAEFALEVLPLIEPKSQVRVISDQPSSRDAMQ
jgi:hypothetical protein